MLQAKNYRDVITSFTYHDIRLLIHILDGIKVNIASSGNHISIHRACLIWQDVTTAIPMAYSVIQIHLCCHKDEGKDLTQVLSHQIGA